MARAECCKLDNLCPHRYSDTCFGEVEKSTSPATPISSKIVNQILYHFLGLLQYWPSLTLQAWYHSVLFHMFLS